MHQKWWWQHWDITKHVTGGSHENSHWNRKNTVCKFEASREWSKKSRQTVCGMAVCVAVDSGRVRKKGKASVLRRGLAHLLAASQTTNLTTVFTRWKALSGKNAAAQMDCVSKNVAVQDSDCRECLKPVAAFAGWQEYCLHEVLAGGWSAQYDGRAQEWRGEVKEH